MGVLHHGAKKLPICGDGFLAGSSKRRSVAKPKPNNPDRSMSHESSSQPSSIHRYINRELSWLEFNSRVLAQAEDEGLPLLERLKFCAIYSSNLDEFFQVRVAGLREQIEAGVTTRPPDLMSPTGQLAAIRQEVLAQAIRLEAVRTEVLTPALAANGICIADYDDLNEDERKRLEEDFDRHIFPVLTPLAVDPSHPFPYISNLSLSVAVLVDDQDLGSLRFARVKVPQSIPRFMSVSEGRFVPVEQVMVACIDRLFVGLPVVGGWAFRVTRNADLSLDESDAEDLLEAVQTELRRRRFGQAVRLEVDSLMPNEARDLLVDELGLGYDDVYYVDGVLDPTGYWQLFELDRPDLKVKGFAGVVPRRLREIEDGHDFFSRIARGDIVVHHPYESFGASVVEMIHQASVDPAVVAIKVTLYRTSGNSPIVDALIKAAETGKQVAVLVELKARFDEANNIGWAQRLESAGVHVAYGLMGLKIHTKTAMVVRAEPDGVRRYCHVGTGNYNSKTARLYEDIGIITADPAVGLELTQLFNLLTGYGRDIVYDRLLVAPHSMRGPLEAMIENEASLGPDKGRIIAKMNSLVDPSLIDRFYEASQAGVEIDLIVRGICCLRAGVQGLSENIRVRSLVGRYLEHSRIYYFANGGGEGVPRYFLGSADLMPRNLDRRVEALIRVDDPDSQDRLWNVFDVNLQDTALAWELLDDDTYRRLGGDVSAHDVFEQLAEHRVGNLLRSK